MSDNRLRLVTEEVANIPQRDAVVADLMWIQRIVIDCAGPLAEGSLTIEYVPMSAAGVLVHTGPNGEDYMRSVSTRTLYADKDMVPELAVAFAAFLSAVKPMEAFKASQKAAKAATSVEDEYTTLQTANTG